MSNAEHTAEPSMEDILSSIRKIIAEEPAAAGPDSSAAQSAAEAAPEPVEPAIGAPGSPQVKRNEEQGSAAAVQDGAGTAAPAPFDYAPSKLAAETTDAAQATTPSMFEPTPSSLSPTPSEASGGAEMSPFDALVAASNTAPAPEAPASPDLLVSSDGTAASVASIAAAQDPATLAAADPTATCAAAPEDLDPLSSLIDQAPDQIASATAPNDDSQVPQPVLGGHDALLNSLSDGLSLPAVQKVQDTDAAGFEAPKPAALREALTERMVPNNLGNDLAANATAPSGAWSSGALSSASETNSPDAEAAQPDPPLSDLLKTLAGAHDNAQDNSPKISDEVGDRLTVSLTGLDELSEDDAQAAVDASTKSSREKLAKTLDALNETASQSDTGLPEPPEPPEPQDAQSGDGMAAGAAAFGVAALAAGLATGSAGFSGNLASSASASAVEHDETKQHEDAPSVDEGTDIEPDKTVLLQPLDPLESLLNETAVTDMADDAEGAMTSGEHNASSTGDDDFMHLVPGADEQNIEPEQSPVDRPLDHAPTREELTSTDAQLALEHDLAPLNVSKTTMVSAASTGADSVSPAATDLIPGSVRTMEDTVSELLRPMLRNWLDDNMPRILEKTLKMELASAIEPDSDTAQTNARKRD